MQQIWTVLQHNGPNHLGLWLNQAVAAGEPPEPAVAAKRTSSIKTNHRWRVNGAKVTGDPQ